MYHKLWGKKFCCSFCDFIKTAKALTQIFHITQVSRQKTSTTKYVSLHQYTKHFSKNIKNILYHVVNTSWPTKRRTDRHTTVVGCFNDLSEGGGVVSLNVWVNGLLHHPFIQLCLGQQAPHSWLIATLSKFVRPVQVVNINNQNLLKQSQHVFIQWKKLHIWWKQILKF